MGRHETEFEARRAGAVDISTLPPLRDLILPKPLEPLRTQFRIAHRVRNVSVPEVVLNGPRVLAVIGEFVAG